MGEDDVKRAFIDGFIAGFYHSGEGYNGEYVRPQYRDPMGCHDHAHFVAEAEKTWRQRMEPPK